MLEIPTKLIRTAPALLAVGAFLGRGQVTRRPTADFARDTTYTVLVRADEMMAMLNQVVFTDTGGTFFPCRIPASKCDSWGHDIALSQPTIKTDGSRLMMSVHIHGTYPMSQFFAPSVQGTLDLSAIPSVQENAIRMTQTEVASGGGDAIFNGFLAVTHDQIAQYVNQKVKIDLVQHLAAATGDPNLPPPRLPGLVCVDPSHLTLTSATTQQAPDAVVIEVHLLTPAGGRSRCA
ncbi:MAG TPA: hypothetical protein VFA43_16930 [Gemmatimonadaceae bacterium]|nr:hypothetical protein [Gemmatimonadaceae bacterium]